LGVSDDPQLNFDFSHPVEQASDQRRERVGLAAHRSPEQAQSPEKLCTCPEVSRHQDTDHGDEEDLSVAHEALDLVRFRVITS
jgi:hypothetical protein